MARHTGDDTMIPRRFPERVTHDGHDWAVSHVEKHDDAPTAVIIRRERSRAGDVREIAAFVPASRLPEIRANKGGP